MKEAGKEEEKHINRLFTPVKRGKRVSERTLAFFGRRFQTRGFQRTALAPGRGLQKTKRAMR